MQTIQGGVAQLAEQRNHNPRVTGSSPVAATKTRAHGQSHGLRLLVATGREASERRDEKERIPPMDGRDSERGEATQARSG